MQMPQHRATINIGPQSTLSHNDIIAQCSPAGHAKRVLWAVQLKRWRAKIIGDVGDKSLLREYTDDDHGGRMLLPTAAMTNSYSFHPALQPTGISAMAGDRKDVNRERNNDGADDDDCQRMAARG